MVGIACSPTSASLQTTAQTPACLQLIALEKQRKVITPQHYTQHLVKHLVIPKIKENERNFLKHFCGHRLCSWHEVGKVS